MLKTYFYALLILVSSTTACGDNSRSEELDKREAAIAERERQVSAISEHYEQLLAMQDSLTKNKLAEVKHNSDDMRWTDSLLGEWESRLVCISTSCRGYVIGDQRTEQWTFLSDTTGLQLQVAGKASDTKSYWAASSGNRNELILKDEQFSQSSKTATVLSFSEIATRQIRGQKRNTGPDNCKLVFSVLLTPRSK
ncbi:hypothetical protein M8998_04155 [Sphingobacterium sp. lm-10]|uniref:hypothetical protein n=1 Tax=Sphingobacterium sp. lm-10 TaxID=2944904 RepID=UPI00201FD524|nr:hypothetical protein [Sphingobacterium sp. lm-10]MCL7987132.1 hypothetical protein [Sphingobacterium sp. lm-10]